MKNTNTKKILKATIAFSTILLLGCTAATDDAGYYGDSEPVSYEIVDNGTVKNNSSVHQEILIDDEAFFDDDELVLITDDQIPDKKDGEGIVLYDETDTERSVAASTPDEPRVIEAKEEKCPTCKKKQAQAATPTATGVEVVVGGADGSVKSVAMDEKTQASPSLPVVNGTIDKNDDIVILEDDNDFIILDRTVNGNNVGDLQEDGDGVVRVQKTVDIHEEDFASSEDYEEAVLKAERDRLKGEMESLTAEKKALEDEKIRITQIQQSNTEACDEVKDWVAAEGTTLRSLLLEWGDRVGWRVVWNMDRDYTLEAGAIFRGRFVDVAAALLRSFARAVPAPKGVFYKGNKVLVISTREDENAD